MLSKFLNDSYIPDPSHQKTYSNKTFQYLSNLPLVLFIIGLNFLLFLLITVLEGENGLWKFGSLNYPIVMLKGEYYRFISAFFLHGNSLHIFINMFSLFMVGTFIEKIFGKINFFILYIVTGLSSTISSFIITQAPESVGASGSIFGIVGGLTIFLVINKRKLKHDIRKKLLIQLFVVISLNLAFGFFSGLRIDNAGHIGGLLSGGVIALFLKPEIFGKKKQSFALLLSIFLFILIIISFIWGIYTYLSIRSSPYITWEQYYF